MKRYIIILVMTILTAKFMASSIMKFMPQTAEHVFESNSFHKIITLFSNHEKDNKLQAQISMPKFKFIPPHFKTPDLRGEKLKRRQELALKLLADEAAKKIANEKKNADRRKDRKKKLEQAQSGDKKTQAVAARTYVAPLAPVIPSFKYPVAPTLELGVNIKSRPTKAPSAPATITALGSATQTADISYWMKTLLVNPSAAQFRIFLSMYKTRQITAAQYYQVVKALAASKNVAARNLAVMGASVEPQAEAFQILADETYNETDSAVQALASQHLQVYANVQYLPLMSQSLSTGDVNTKTAVTHVVDQIALIVKSSPQTITSTTKTWLTLFASDFTSYLKTGVSAQSTASLLASTQQALTDVKAALGLS